MTESLTDCVMWHICHMWFGLNCELRNEKYSDSEAVIVQGGVLFWSEVSTSCMSQVDLTPPFPLTKSLWSRISPVVEFKQEVHGELNRK